MAKVYNTSELRAVLEGLGYRLTDSGNEFWRTFPKYRQAKHSSLAINKRNGRFTDFGGNIAGSLEDLIKLTTGETTVTLNLELIEAEEKLITDVYFDKSCVENLVPSYDLFLKRGISKETLQLFGAGLSLGGKMNRRIVFAIYDRKMRIVGLDGRYSKEAVPEGAAKWKKLGRKSGFLYPWHLSEDSIKEKREVILCESLGDCLALYEAGIKNVLVLFGTVLSSKLLSYIVELDPLNIIICLNDDRGLDNDLAGNVGAEKVKNKLTMLFTPSKIEIRPPDKNDLCDMLTAGGKESILEWYRDNF